MIFKTFRSSKVVFIAFFLTLVTLLLSLLGQKKENARDYSSTLGPGVPNAVADAPSGGGGDSGGAGDNAGDADCGTDTGSDCSGGP